MRLVVAILFLFLLIFVFLKFVLPPPLYFVVMVFIHLPLVVKIQLLLILSKYLISHQILCSTYHCKHLEKYGEFQNQDAKIKKCAFL